ncbi:unnamed protein product [Nippostrongylus brasiliensis]|uniref:non-specific serine/threonine protein kinase n=1 Tax=Nippostrongylus brasiliensis TaxID=27835 RepID=A0A0N4YUV8_NIPBR|nr:unnamed protein product [Nippostrongylus brasiliensis]
MAGAFEKSQTALIVARSEVAQTGAKAEMPKIPLYQGVPQIHDDSSRMVGSRRPLTHRSSHGKKRVDIVYRSKWITNNFVVGDPLGAGMVAVPAPGFNPKHIAMELKVMRTISGGPNVVEFIAAYREMDRVFVVMNFFPHDDIFSLIHKIPLAETLEYMRNLFIALHHIHRYRVIHRDIKPANFLYNRAERRYLLVDFGLSHFVTSNHSRKRSADLSPSLKENVSSPFEPPAKRCKVLNDDVLILPRPPFIRHPKCGCTSFGEVCDACNELPAKHMNKAGTPGYRAPEVLLRFEEQTTEIDIFAAGITMLSFLLRKHPIFRPNNDVEALTQMATFLGSSSLAAADNGVTLLCDPPIPGMDMVKLAHNYGRDIREAEKCELGCKSCSLLIYQNNTGFCFCKQSERDSIAKLTGSERVAFEVLSRKQSERDSIAKLTGSERVAFEVLSRSLEPNPRKRYTARMLADLIEPHRGLLCTVLLDSSWTTIGQSRLRPKKFDAGQNPCYGNTWLPVNPAVAIKPSYAVNLFI